MNRDFVSSTDVASIGYDPVSRTLEVEFRSGGLYDYLDVPENSFHQLMNAPSKGRFLNDHVKPRFRFRKLR